MKKSLIWLLTAVMAITFGALLYFQITYLDNMVSMREAQFSEGVMRSLHAATTELERIETLHFLEEDVNIIAAGFYDDVSMSPSDDDDDSEEPDRGLSLPSPTRPLSDRYRAMQETLRSQYLYQQGLLSDIILTILRDAGTRPITERADSTQIRSILGAELASNGLKVPFVFAVTSSDGGIVYRTNGFSDDGDARDQYSDPLFPGTESPYNLVVQFPTKESYVFSSVRFIIPTLALTVFLLVIFLFTIIVMFRQKKLSEIKTDFVNNMTHELKTPISTISLAGQMLNDESVRKSPATLKHLSNVINDESKRLRFQVEKVLQMSVFDDTGGALKFTEFNANGVIDNVVNTFKIKVEKFGGSIKMDLEAPDAEIYADEMQFTNVIFNLFDNAVKYRREDVAPQLEVATFNPNDSKLQIVIRDNGIGIKRENLKRIFDKFYRVPKGNLHDVKGFGLGLTYVKKMVNIFGGTISADSEYGKWTEFVIVLPVANAAGHRHHNLK